MVIKIFSHEMQNIIPTVQQKFVPFIQNRDVKIEKQRSDKSPALSRTMHIAGRAGRPGSCAPGQRMRPFDLFYNTIVDTI